MLGRALGVAESDTTEVLVALGVTVCDTRALPVVLRGTDTDGLGVEVNIHVALADIRALPDTVNHSECDAVAT